MPAGSVLRITFVQYLIAFSRRPGAITTGDVMSGTFVGPVVPDNHVKFGDPRLKLYREKVHMMSS